MGKPKRDPKNHYRAISENGDTVFATLSGEDIEIKVPKKKNRKSIYGWMKLYEVVWNDLEKLGLQGACVSYICGERETPPEGFLPAFYLHVLNEAMMDGIKNRYGPWGKEAKKFPPDPEARSLKKLHRNDLRIRTQAVYAILYGFIKELFKTEYLPEILEEAKNIIKDHRMCPIKSKHKKNPQPAFAVAVCMERLFSEERYKFLGWGKPTDPYSEANIMKIIREGGKYITRNPGPRLEIDRDSKARSENDSLDRVLVILAKCFNEEVIEIDDHLEISNTYHFIAKVLSDTWPTVFMHKSGDQGVIKRKTKIHSWYFYQKSNCI
ncbi:MAG TPA: hypothetical protein PK874_13750 [Desulfobacteraceae bacterium]|nr:hypothetical protein [Desulfobacteraceae bacterium]